jgi:predicted dehydrogenase
MKKEIRLALVGAGAIGKTHAAAAFAAPGMRLVAVCDAELDRALEVAGDAANAYCSLDAMLAAEQIDGAIVATPPITHRDITERLAAHGVNVLCEKPLATTPKDARAMMRAAGRYDVIVSMASKFRFVDDVRRARELIRNGDIGELLLLENAFTSAVPMAGRWNSRPEISGGGVIIDNGTHAVDLFRYLAGPLESVRATEYRRYQQLEVEDTAMLVARAQSGVVAMSDLSWTIDKRLPYYLRIHGSEGTIDLGWKAAHLQRNGEAQAHVIGTGYSKNDAFRGLLTNFARAIAGEEPIEVSASEAIASVSAIDAAYRAMSRTNWPAVAA